MNYFIKQYRRRESGVPDAYKGLLLNELQMLNEEQRGLKEDFRQMWRFDLVEEADELYAKEVPNREEAFKEIKRQYRGPHPWSVSVIGTVGNGKTTLATAMVNLFNCQFEYFDEFAYYTTQTSLMNEYKENFDKKVLDKYIKCELLVIDELNPKDSDWTEFARSTVQNILNERYSNKKRTVIIGNLSPEEFKQMFEPHIISRLREGLTRVMTGADLRRSYRR